MFCNNVRHMTQDSQDLGASLNTETKRNLHNALQKVYTSRNLLVIPQHLSKLVNFLTLFLELKTHGKIEKSLFLENLLLIDVPPDYDGLILIVDTSNIPQLSQVWPRLKAANTRTTLIVKDLTRLFHYELSTKVLGKADFDSSLNFKLDAVLHLPGCRVVNWQTLPICLEEFVLIHSMQNDGLESYIDNPLLLISELALAVGSIVGATREQPLKFRNAFAKGDHALLLLNKTLSGIVPKVLAAYPEGEQQFYNDKLRGNCDIVVLERNLDWFPLLLSQLTYLGLLDDIFGTADIFANTLSTGVKLNDELYDSLKNLNFASVGAQLNSVARYLQLEFESTDKMTEILEIRKLVNNLKSLKNKQALVKTHTDLSEAIIQETSNDLTGPDKYNARQEWLELQGEMFELDYKLQVAKIHDLMALQVPSAIVLSMIVAVSLTSDGFRRKDLDAIETAVTTNFGLAVALKLEKLVQLRLVKVNAKANDFFASFTFGKSDIETTTPSTSALPTAPAEKPYEDLEQLGLTGGQDAYKSTYTLISKFWNLHPIEDESPVAKSFLEYTSPSFALPASTVPLTYRMVESLYYRDFLKYKPVTSLQRRPNWEGLNMDAMFKGQTIDRNLCDDQDKRKVDDEREKVVLLVLLGGITRSEVSLFAHLRAKLKAKKKLLYVLTTGFVGNRHLIDIL